MQWWLKQEAPTSISRGSSPQRDIIVLAEKTFATANITSEGWLRDWCNKTFAHTATPAKVVKECTDVIVDNIIAKLDQEEKTTKRGKYLPF